MTDFIQPDVLSKISRLELRARRTVEGFLSGMHKSPYKGFSVEFADYRAYVPGDDVRHLDWRAYAKTDRLVIKEYEVETNLRTHIVLDCSGSMAYPEHKKNTDPRAPLVTSRDRKGAVPRDGLMTKWNYAATIAASIAHLLVRQQDGVGLTLFDHEIRKQLPVTATRAGLSGFVQALAEVEPAESTNVKFLFHRLADQVPRRGLVVLISDLLTEFDDIVNGLQRFKFGQHDVMVLHVLDHDELEFPFVDQTLFEGMEGSDLEILTDPQSLRSAYVQAVQQFITRIRAACLNHGVDYALMSTADPIDVALTRLLANRARRNRPTA